MGNREPFAPGEWYHCYNRGVEKRRVFETPQDYERFLLLMFVANGTKAVHISNLREKKLISVLQDLSIDKGEPLVEIGGYCLMPNHFHFVLKELKGGGIALFMQKLFTGYTMYFNKKSDRTGALFAGVFKSKHISDDRYLKWLMSYVHLNPVELFEKGWKDGKGNVDAVQNRLTKYSYSSCPDFFDRGLRVQSKLLGKSIFELFEKKVSIRQMLEDAQAYYKEINIKVSP